MKCVNCDNKKTLKSKSVTKKYDECGLPNVVLVGVTKFSCPKCGEEYFHYGNVLQLNALIKDNLIQKRGLLTGPEIRFIRKQLGFSKEYFGHILGVEERTIYRWESGKNITKQVDRSIRIVASLQDSDRNYTLHEALLDDKKSKKYKHMRINLSGHEPHISLT